MGKQVEGRSFFSRVSGLFFEVRETEFLGQILCRASGPAGFGSHSLLWRHHAWPSLDQQGAKCYAQAYLQLSLECFTIPPVTHSHGRLVQQTNLEICSLVNFNCVFILAVATPWARLSPPNSTVLSPTCWMSSSNHTRKFRLCNSRFHVCPRAFIHAKGIKRILNSLCVSCTWFLQVRIS